MVSYLPDDFMLKFHNDVLILVVMEDGLVHRYRLRKCKWYTGLNPCCNGRWSRTAISAIVVLSHSIVLILVVMEDGLVLVFIRLY